MPRSSAKWTKSPSIVLAAPSGSAMASALVMLPAVHSAVKPLALHGESPRWVPPQRLACSDMCIECGSDRRSLPEAQHNWTDLRPAMKIPSARASRASSFLVISGFAAFEDESLGRQDAANILVKFIGDTGGLGTRAKRRYGRGRLWLQTSAEHQNYDLHPPISSSPAHPTGAGRWKIWVANQIVPVTLCLDR